MNSHSSVRTLLRALTSCGILASALLVNPAVEAQQSQAPTVSDPSPVKATPFPGWMDSVTFPGDKRSLQGPQEPIDPDPTSSVKPPAGPGEKSRFQFNPPKMPDLSAIRKKAWKSTYQRIGSDTQALQYEQFTAANVEAEKKRQHELGLLLDAFPPGTQRDEIGGMLRQQQGRVAAAEELLRLIGSATGLASVAVELGTLGLSSTQAQVQSTSSPLAPLLDIGGSAPLDLSRPSSLSATLVPAPEKPARAATPPRDAKTDRRIRELLHLLYPAATPEMPEVKAPGSGKPLKEPDTARLSPAANASPTVPAPGASAPAAASTTRPATADDDNRELDTSEPARIPERFYRPSATPSLYRDNQDDSPGD